MIFAGSAPRRSGAEVLPSSTGGRRNGLRCIAGVPLGTLGPVLACAFNRFAALSVALAISRSSTHWGLGTRQVPSIAS